MGELDNRGSHFYLSMYWAEALALQNTDTALKAEFADISMQLSDNEHKILEELNTIQGQSVDLGGYYLPNDSLANKAMRASDTFNTIITSI